MKLSLVLAACLLITGCGAAASVDYSAVPGDDSGSSSNTGNGSSSGGSGGSVGGSGSSSGGSGSSSSGADSGSSSGSSSGGGDPDGGVTTGDPDGGSGSSSGGGSGDDGGTIVTADSGSGGSSGDGGDDGGATVADGGNGGTADSGTGGSGDDGGSTSSDGGTTVTDSGSSGGPGTDSGSGGNADGGHCCAPKCVLTQGYYKNHTSSWPILSVVMGTNSYDETACLSLLNDSVVGDESIVLAKQYIAAVENGGLCDPNASALMTQAQAWFTTNQNGLLPYHIYLPDGACTASDPGCQAESLGASLDTYNNGLSGTPACQ